MNSPVTAAIQSAAQVARLVTAVVKRRIDSSIPKTAALPRRLQGELAAADVSRLEPAPEADGAELCPRPRRSCVARGCGRSPFGFFFPTVLATAVACGQLTVLAQEHKPGAATSISATEDAEATYTQAIEKRTADILEVLKLTDPAVSGRVHDTIIAQYRALRSWHDANDAPLKQARKTDTNAVADMRASLKELHDRFIAKLAADLSPEQVEQVKDKMTYGKVKVTYDAYCEIVPHLTETEKARMLQLLKEAREEAMDCGSAEEKSAVFNRYKGKINNYLTAQGHDVGKAFRDFNQRQREQKATRSAPTN
jgi:hypothetical protein